MVADMAQAQDPLALKEQGNGLFKSGEYKGAADFYSQAIDSLEGDTSEQAAVIFKNRAACHLKLGQYDEAIDDCNKSINMGGGDAKAYYRRAQAYQNKKMLDKALKDAMEAARIDPKNKPAVSMVLELRADIQSRRDIMNSTKGIVDEMLNSLDEEGASMDKKEQAMKNLVNVATTGSGADTIIAKKGLPLILKHIFDTKLQVHAVNCIICICRDSVRRTKHILDRVPLKTSLKILKVNGEGAELIGGLLYEMLNSVIEDKTHDYTNRILGQAPKKFPVPELLPTFFSYFEECLKIAQGEGLKSLVNAWVRTTDSRVFVEQVQLREHIKILLELVIQGRLGVEEGAQISIIVSKVWARTRVDDKITLAFVKQCSSVINPRINAGSEQQMASGVKGLNIVIQGSFEAGGDVMRDCTEVYRVVSKLLCSQHKDIQCAAAECIALMSSDKKMCYNLADQNFNLLKALYKSEQVDDSVKLRSLVGMCKMVAAGGSDINKKIVQEGAGGRLHKQLRGYLVKNPSPDVQKWVVEAYAYLTIDAEVKEFIVNDNEQMKIICSMSVVDANTAYSVGCMVMNMTNSYDKQEADEEMVKLANFAKQTVPEEHEFDSEGAVNKRIGLMVKAGVVPVLVACASADSLRTKEIISRCFTAIVKAEEGKNCGSVVAAGGTRAMLDLFSNNTDIGRRTAAHGIAKIAIKMNPSLAFSGQKALDACRPCISMIDSTKQDEFLIYDGLLALTNLASVGNSVRERIMREKGCHAIEYQQFEDNVVLRRAATECICNMALSEKVRERYFSEDELFTPNDRLKMIFVLCGDEDEPTRLAALGAMAYLTQEDKVCKCVVRIGSWIEVIKEIIVVEDVAHRHRLLVMLQNMLCSDKETAETIINTEVFECLLALYQIMQLPPAIKAILQNCMDAAKHWGLIQTNPGDMIYTTAPPSATIEE